MKKFNLIFGALLIASVIGLVSCSGNDSISFDTIEHVETPNIIDSKAVYGANLIRWDYVDCSSYKIVITKPNGDRRTTTANNAGTGFCEYQDNQVDVAGTYKYQIYAMKANMESTRTVQWLDSEAAEISIEARIPGEDEMGKTVVDLLKNGDEDFAPKVEVVNGEELDSYALRFVPEAKSGITVTFKGKNWLDYELLSVPYNASMDAENDISEDVSVGDDDCVIGEADVSPWSDDEDVDITIKASLPGSEKTRLYLKIAAKEGAKDYFTSGWLKLDNWNGKDASVDALENLSVAQSDLGNDGKKDDWRVTFDKPSDAVTVKVAYAVYPDGEFKDVDVSYKANSKDGKVSGYADVADVVKEDALYIFKISASETGKKTYTKYMAKKGEAVLSLTAPTIEAKRDISTTDKNKVYINVTQEARDYVDGNKYYLASAELTFDKATGNLRYGSYGADDIIELAPVADGDKYRYYTEKIVERGKVFAYRVTVKNGDQIKVAYTAGIKPASATTAINSLSISIVDGSAAGKVKAQVVTYGSTGSVKIYRAKINDGTELFATNFSELTSVTTTTVNIAADSTEFDQAATDTYYYIAAVQTVDEKGDKCYVFDTKIYPYY